MLSGFVYLMVEHHLPVSQIDGTFQKSILNIFLVSCLYNNYNIQTLLYLSGMKRDDTLWKAILEDVFDDFLVFFFKEQAELFDLERGFEFLDKELEQLFPSGDDKTETKFVDKLVKVFTKAGTEEWILVHIEVQGYNDADFASRMFTYFCRIYDRYKKPVTSIAIFTDARKSYRPQQFDYSFLGTQAMFRYNTYKVIDQEEEELRNSNNPFAIVILTVLLALKKGKIKEEKLFSLKTSLLKNLLQKEISRGKIDAILIFLRNYVRFDNAEIIAKFDNEISILTNKHTTMGIREFVLQRAEREGREKERTEKNHHFVKSLLTQTDFPVERIAQVAEVTVDFVKEVKATLGKSPN